MSKDHQTIKEQDQMEELVMILSGEEAKKQRKDLSNFYMTQTKSGLV